MRRFSFSVTQEVLDLGVKIITARISGVENKKSDANVDTFINTEVEVIKKKWQGRNWKEDTILQGFRDLHTKVGRSNRDYPASPEVLLKNLLEKDRFPRINAVVDIYNIISLKIQLALGAHNIEKIQGNITLRLTDGTEHFLPLGKSEEEKVFPGEYAYCDDNNTIICRLEVLQVELTKIGLDAKDIFFIIQGNANTTNEYVQNGAEELCETITKFLGGEFQLLNTL